MLIGRGRPARRSGSIHRPDLISTSVPEAKKEEQEQEVVLSRPSSSATTTVVVANGDPPFRKVTGPAVRSKVVCHSYGADRFTTSAPLSDISG
ncbi:hypothetical protein L2E82_33355 [Cichorium intybus]|uniref:Uncharacterized protein n=1 Tax=Cichorium intybus TaxID=13427 RepID=A0ACB9BJX4_CICIN|nr:hypothetical protein L2E82_33355 [Cichorium intybus]